MCFQFSPTPNKLSRTTYVGRLCTILISKKRPVLFKAISFLALSHDCLYNDIFRKAICMLLGGTQRAKFAEKVHKPPLAVNVINFELNEFNASI